MNFYNYLVLITLLIDDSFISFLLKFAIIFNQKIYFKKIYINSNSIILSNIKLINFFVNELILKN